MSVVGSGEQAAQASTGESGRTNAARGATWRYPSGGRLPCPDASGMLGGSVEPGAIVRPSSALDRISGRAAIAADDPGVARLKPGAESVDAP